MLLSIWLTPQRRTKKNILKILGTKKDKFKFGGQKENYSNLKDLNTYLSLKCGRIFSLHLSCGLFVISHKIKVIFLSL